MQTDAATKIHVDNLVKRYGERTVFSDVSFDVKEGEIVSIVGPSGCGKTTLLRLVSGLLQPTGGAVLREDRPIAGPSPDVAIVFQDYGRALLPWRTVTGNVSLALEEAHVPKAEASARACPARRSWFRLARAPPKRLRDVGLLPQILDVRGDPF